MSYTEKDPQKENGPKVPLSDNQKGTTFSDRLRKAIDGKSIRQFAADCGISYGAMHKYFAGHTQPTLDNLVVLARTAGVSIEWLATGEQSSTGTNLISRPATPPSTAINDVHGNEVDLEEFIFVPRYNVTASAGYGAWNDDETPMFTVSFRRYWVVNHLKADPKQLSVISVQGDSMEGVLNDKDIILVNHGDREPREGIYVLRLDGQLIVKRVQRLPGAQLIVTSTNPVYKPFNIDLNNVPSDFCIVGKVVWYGRVI
ncbi:MULTISPECIES: helix-turn-helix transcriptional regulator [Enterobacteriaceae]|uniref:Phage repressor protein CI n=1 Tax=Enterobacter roggenkampii TaxID=1812935 RepID=A0ABD7KPX9_9ENTR|nr:MULTISPECIES: helix-turn-helix transcriptional regulator [Enterobacteriaceae]AYY04898.1 helix-turn-helix transcriptional regulator [Enterobacter roggenkampii]MDM3207674.1 helix-turn-helix transcriptional regulator [Citrobacter sp. Cf099]MDV1143024.1 helix-turn-helix transcriptional regulator [Citrobacter freundii]MDV1163253.1 helix-turn-helix transcriptional regulator [Citrobacter freundii]MDV1168475.1 helix-turn-helix transcriptional regulator [Citrobacter freundii]